MVLSSIYLSYDSYSMDNVLSKHFYDHTCNITFARTQNVFDNVRVNIAFSS